MRNTIVLAALVLALARILCAGPVGVVGTIRTTVSIMDDLFVVIECNAAGCEAPQPFPESSGVTPPVTANYALGYGSAPFTYGFLTVIGLDSTGTHVIVGLASDVDFVGQAWPFATAETTVESDLESGNTAALAAFFSADLSGGSPETSSFWIPFTVGTLTTGNIAEFSNGVAVGTITAVATPEPGTLGITGFLLAGGLLLLRSRTVERPRQRVE